MSKGDHTPRAKIGFMDEMEDLEPIELHRLRSVMDRDIERLKELKDGQYRNDYGPHVPTGGFDREIEIREGVRDKIDNILDKMEDSQDPYYWSSMIA